MTIAEQFKQYVWIIKTIYNTRRISFEELNERWQDTEMSGGLPMVRATFKRNKQAIQDMFAVNILCDATDGYRYYIENREDLRSPTLQRWMMDLLLKSNNVSEGARDYFGVIGMIMTMDALSPTSSSPVSP